MVRKEGERFEKLLVFLKKLKKTKISKAFFQLILVVLMVVVVSVNMFWVMLKISYLMLLHVMLFNYTLFYAILIVKVDQLVINCKKL